MDLVGFEVTAVVRASNAAVWAVLGDFGEEHHWTKTLKHCEQNTQRVQVGTIRTCQLPKPLMGLTEAREKLIEYSPGVALAYALDGSAGPFATAYGRWSTRSMWDGSTAVTVEGRFEPKSWLIRFLLWPFLKPVLGRFARSVVRELDTFLRAQRR